MSAQAVITKRVRIISFYEILAGAIGFVVTLIKLVNEYDKIKKPDLIVSIVLLVICIITLYAGIMLSLKNKAGLMLSYLIQVAQIPVIMIKGLHYNFFIGLSLAIGKNQAGDFILQYFAGTGLFYKIGMGRFEFLGINFLAAIIVLMLIKSIKDA